MKIIIKLLIVVCACYFLTFFNVVTASDLTVWNNLVQDFKLDHKVNSPEVRTEIRKLMADKKKFNRILIASTPYIYYIHQQTSLRHLPGEIALIPFIESEFSPNDFSQRSGALGLWQLIPSLARILGVKNDNGGRHNIVKSTQAALSHFKYLGSYYKNNWYLAIAAYNCGQGRVNSAIRAAGTRNIFNLNLPRETKLYVPQLLAVATIVKNPQKYGIELPSIPNQPYFTELKMKQAASLQQIAKKLNVNINVLYALNPQYKYGAASQNSVSRLFVPVKQVG